ncbi:MAG: dihydrofolate reductase family protein [Candidatus Thorarchaeota archaeon]
MANFVYIATSLDGFIATSEGDLDWLDEIPNPEGHDFGYAKFMSGIDALVMGRKTFEKVASFGVWPYSMPVFVLSRSKISVPPGLENKVEIVNKTPKKLVDDLIAHGYQNLYIDGGITIQNFLADDLIDEMIITRVPVLLGSGIPLFGTLRQRQYFKHEKTDVINEILVKSHYTRIRE